MSAPGTPRRLPNWLRSPIARGVLLALAAALLLVGVACESATSAASGPAGSAATAVQRIGAAAEPNAGQAQQGDARQAAARSAPASPGDQKPSGALDAERERIAARATWAPGSLQSHFEKHGAEGPYRSAAEYDAAARETIRIGTRFTYQDRESNAERLGFYDRAGNRFTGVTRDGGRITTHFRPNRGEAYVRGLERSTYR